MKGSSVLPLLALAIRAAHGCDCGYIVNGTGPNGALFTEALETDFLHVYDWYEGWGPSGVKVSPGDTEWYGQDLESENVYSNVITSAHDYKGPGENGSDPGLVLWNKATLVNGSEPYGLLVSMAEIVSKRGGFSFTYGSFRVAMMTTNVNGTCGGFFLYGGTERDNDTRGIGMELLSRQQQDKSGAVNLFNQSPMEKFGLGYVNKSSPGFSKHHLDFSPYTGYNEYRFDWLPDRIDYYVNGKLLSTTTENVPDGNLQKIHLIHGSNGDPGWSGGPPKDDAALRISYVKAYYNTSEVRQTTISLSNCTSSSDLCLVRTQDIPPNPLGSNGNVTGKTQFFNEQWRNKAARANATAAQNEASRNSMVWGGFLVLVVMWSLIGF